MFYDLLLKTPLKKVVTSIDCFYSSYIYMGIVAALVFLSSVFSFEIPFYYSVALLAGVIPTLLCHDDTAALPPLILCYYSLSKASYITDRNDPSFIFSPQNLVHFSWISGIIIVCFLTRFIYNLVAKKTHAPRSLFYTFLPYLLMLCIAGFTFEKHQIKDYYYGMGVAASYLLPFFVTTFLVDHEKIKKDYLFALLTSSCLVLTLQTAYCVFSNLDVISQTGFTGDIFCLGWGIKNNLGGMLVMSMAGPIYFIIKQKHTALFLILNFLVYGCVILTLSRNALLVGTLVEIIFAIYVFVAVRPLKKVILSIYGTFALCAIIIICIPDLLKKISPMAYDLFYNFSWSMLLNGRENLYMFGFQSFLKQPVFGTGYYHIEEFTGPMYTSRAFPFRYHNTLVQLLASTGSIGLIAYVIHRVDTVYQCLRQTNKAKLSILLTIFAFGVLSLGDCHPFNIGPAIFMAIVYGFLDNANSTKKKPEELLTKGLESEIN